MEVMTVTNTSGNLDENNTGTKLPRLSPASPTKPHSPQSQLVHGRTHQPTTVTLGSAAPSEGSIGLPKIDLQSKSRNGSEQKRKKNARRARQMGLALKQQSTSSYSDDGSTYLNPEPLPFQSQYFNHQALGKVHVLGMSVATPKDSATVSQRESATPAQKNLRRDAQKFDGRSSTALKKITMSKRHGDLWNGVDYALSRTKGFFYQSERYQWDEIGIDGNSQRDRLQSEVEFLERMKGWKRRGEFAQHRQQLDLMMGGRKVVFNEKVDIIGELTRLKGIVLPTKARDLYVGRGFKLPEDHAVYKPRSSSVMTEAKKSMTTPKSDAFLPNGDKDNTGQPRHTRVDITITNQGDINDRKPQNLPEAQMDIGDNKDTKTISNQLQGAIAQIKTEELEGHKGTFEGIQKITKGNKVKFEDIQPQLSKKLTENEEIYISKIYDMVVADSSLDLNTYVSIMNLSTKVASLSGALKAGFTTLDLSTVKDTITKYTDSFNSGKHYIIGNISLEELQGLLYSESGQGSEQSESKEEFYKRIKKDLQQGQEGLIDTVTITDFLAYIPYFVTLEPKKT